MVVIMKVGAHESQIQQASRELERLGFKVHRVDGMTRTILGAIGDKRGIDPHRLAVLDGVEGVVEITKPYKLASREFNPDGTVVTVGDVQIGGADLAIIAGPCSVESEEQIAGCARLVAQQGVRLLRGGAFKPRTSPYSFQGLGEAGLKMLRAAADRYGLYVATALRRPRGELRGSPHSDGVRDRWPHRRWPNGDLWGRVGRYLLSLVL
jgi:3-deoxy-7-phosphoheptulonate synthase